MADKRLNSLNDYEQLKRRNRRRLVGASVMVVLAGLLLAKVLNQGESSQDATQSISINGTSDPQAASEAEVPQVAINNQASSADDASDLSPAAVLEPAPEGNTHATVLENPLTSAETTSVPVEAKTADPNKIFTDAVVNEPVESTPPTEAPKAVAAETKPATPAVRSNTAAPPPVVVINNQAVDKPAPIPTKPATDKPEKEKAQQATDKAAAEQKAAQQRQVEQRAADARKREAQQAAARAAEEKKAQQAQQAKQQAEREQAKKQADAATKQKQQAAAQKKPQDILNNKAAQATAKADPKAILEGRSNATGGKAIIQAGAFSNREQAVQIRQKLANAGVSAYISEAETSKGTVYRVRTGSYADRAAANQALAKIRQQGVDGMVIGQ